MAAECRQMLHGLTPRPNYQGWLAASKHRTFQSLRPLDLYKENSTSLAFLGTKEAVRLSHQTTPDAFTDYTQLQWLETRVYSGDHGRADHAEKGVE